MGTNTTYLVYLDGELFKQIYDLKDFDIMKETAVEVGCKLTYKKVVKRCEW